MKPPLIALAAMAVAFAGCTTTPTTQPQSLPLYSTIEGKKCVVTPIPMFMLKPGQLVVFRYDGENHLGTIAEQRGENVFRLKAEGFVLLTPANYLGRAAVIAN